MWYAPAIVRAGKAGIARPHHAARRGRQRREQKKNDGGQDGRRRYQNLPDRWHVAAAS